MVAEYRWATKAVLLALLVAGGCAPEHRAGAIHDPVVVAAAPLLGLDPDADWTASYNRLIALGPKSVAWLAEDLRRQATNDSDDLRLLLSTSLLHLIAYPARRPGLSVQAFETRDGVLFFEPKVAGRSIGHVHMLRPMAPRRWQDLYPADFNHRLAAAVDLAGDREAMLAWYALMQAQEAPLATTLPLSPMLDRLWPALGAAPADRWSYVPATGQIRRVAWSPQAAPLFEVTTYDYNFVRAACIQLGQATDPAIQAALIDCLASPVPVVAHNARFALTFSPDPAVQRVLRRYQRN